MRWLKGFCYIPQYDHTNTNQHGRTYRQTGSRVLSTAKMIAKISNADDLSDLILLSHHLDVPVHYDFSTNPQTAYIEVVSRGALEKK